MRKKETEVELLKCIISAKKELAIASKNFEMAEEELIDYYSYEIKATKAKLDYLIKQVKTKEITLDMINNLKLGIEEIRAI